MQIIDRLLSLRRREHEATVALVETLVECHHARAHVDAGYRSVFQLLVERLGYTPAAASRRFAAMRCALRGTFVVDMLREDRTSLTALAKVAPILEDVVDAAELLRSIDGLGPREVDATIAAMRPIPKPVERVRPVAVARPKATTSGVGTLWGSSTAERNASTADHRPQRTAPPESAPAVEREDVEPRVALSFTMTRTDHAALERARAKMSRTRPRPLTLEETIVALVDGFEAREQKAEARPTPKRSTEASSSRRTRHIPTAVRRTIFERDGNRCTFVAPDGTRCSARHDLQIDHLVPFASGGGNDPSNLRVLCGAHNRRMGEMDFGWCGGGVRPVLGSP